jgi:flagella basal body P-ring formation protein FlgA
MALLMPVALADIVVIVRRQAESAGNYIRVCDVARVEGPREAAREVAETIIGPTPEKGQEREITRWEIESRLYEMGLSATVTFSGNESVRVSGNGAPSGRREDAGFVPGELEPVALASVTEAATTDPGDYGRARRTAAARSDAEIPQSATPANEDVSARQRIGAEVSRYLASRYNREDIEVRAKVISLSEGLSPGEEFIVAEAVGGRMPGKAEVALKVVGPEADEGRRIIAVLDTEIYALAPVATKPLYKGDVIAARDVAIDRVKMRAGQAYLPPDAMAAVGREVQRPIKPREPILPSDAKNVDAVKQGMNVYVDNRGVGWSVQAVAKALGGGNVDDIITVENPGTRHRYRARIIGPGRVTSLIEPDPINKR